MKYCSFAIIMENIKLKKMFSRKKINLKYIFLKLQKE